MVAVPIPKPEERTIKRPVSNCAGCGATKVSMALKEGLRRYNKDNKTKLKLESHLFSEPKNYPKIIGKLTLPNVANPPKGP